MAGEPNPFPSPTEFRGNFSGYIEAIEQHLESTYEGDAGEHDSVAHRAASEAPILAAQTWLVERWGTHYPCPVCSNVEWGLSGVAAGPRPAGYFGFYITCGYCGNTMHVVPGLAQQEDPTYATEQFQLPEQ